MAFASATYSLVENSEQPVDGQAMALVELSHTATEHQLYAAMLAEISSVGTRVASFSTRRLMSLTGVNAYSSVRRGLAAGGGHRLLPVGIERLGVHGAFQLRATGRNVTQD